jgi:uncharacterized protein
MSWSLCVDVDEFLEKRRWALLVDESANCLAWAVIERSKTEGPDGAGYTFLTFDEGHASSAHAFIKVNGGEQHLVLGQMSCAQAELLLGFVESQGIRLGIVEGPREATLTFAQGWALTAGRFHHLQLNLGLYELTHLKMVDLEGGRLYQATEAHRERLTEYITGFCRDCFPEQPMAQEMIEARVTRFITQRRAHFWQTSDQELVAMAAVVRESPNTASISWVYTAPSHRKRGYAARIVAALSQAQLDDGKRACNLHTDLSNPTSNGVYRRIGYEQIAERINVKLGHH